LRAAEAAGHLKNGEKEENAEKKTRENWPVMNLSWRTQRGLGFPQRSHPKQASET
jgi:hypothetical protein